MRYIGAIKSPMPWNGFMESIYTNDQGDFFILEIDADNAVFEKTDITSQEITWATEGIDAINEKTPVYSYIAGNDYQLLYGKYEDLFKKCIPFLLDEAQFNISRQIIASFFRLHGFTAALIHNYEGPSIIQLDLADSLPHKTLQEIEQLEQIIGKQRDLLMIHQFSIKDFIYIDHHHFYVDQWKISLQDIAAFVDRQPANSISRNIMLDVFNDYDIASKLGESEKMHELLEKGVGWLCELAYARSLARKYNDSRLESKFSSSFASMSYATENNISNFAETTETDAAFDMQDNLRNMAGRVKASLQTS